MPITKYKLQKNSDGTMQPPSYIKDGGYWFNSKDNSMIGWYDYSYEYEVKENIEELTKKDLELYLLNLHANNPFKTSEKVNMTNAEVISMSNTWYDEMFNKNFTIPENVKMEDVIFLQNIKTLDAFNYMEKMLENATVNIPIVSANTSCPFGCDSITQDNIIGINTAIARGIPIPNPTYWTPKGYPFPIEVTHNELAAIGGEILNKKNEYYGIYFTHKANIIMESNYGVIAKYDFTTGYSK